MALNVLFCPSWKPRNIQHIQILENGTRRSYVINNYNCVHLCGGLSQNMQTSINHRCAWKPDLFVVAWLFASFLLMMPEFILNRVSSPKVLHFTPRLYFHTSYPGTVLIVSTCKFCLIQKEKLLRCIRYRETKCTCLGSAQRIMIVSVHPPSQII